MGDQDDGLGGPDDVDDPRLRLRPEVGVAGGQDLVEQQDVRVDRRRDGEPESGAHPGRIGPQRRVDEVAELRVVDDRRQELAGHPVIEAEERAAEQDVVASGQVLVEAGAQGQQAGHVPDDVDRTLRRVDDPGEHLEERALARAVRPDDRERLPALDVQVDVAQRPELVDLAAADRLSDRAPDRRLPGEPQVVADAEVGGADRVVGPLDRASVVDGRIGIR